MMTATPIPRTLAMSYYADLDVSTLDELPPGRTPVVTKVISEHRRDEVIERIRGQLAQGRQVYWVCPLIEDSEALDLTNATQTHAELSAALSGAHPTGGQAVMVGLLHSRMPVADKKAVMSLFTGGQMGVLVSTTVIEVGVDVPNASLMVIEHAERFGLSQLHQLRGRVGRGRRGLGLRAAVFHRRRPAPGRNRAGAPARHGRDGRRLRDRAPRPGNPGPRRVSGRAAIGRAAAAFCRSRHRHRTAGMGPPDRPGDARPTPRIGPPACGPLVGRKIRVSEGLTDARNTPMTLTELKYIVAVIPARAGRGAPLAGIDPREESATAVRPGHRR